MRRRLLILLLPLFVLLLAAPAEAKNKKKAAQRAFIAEATEALKGPLWALKDLPVYTGMTMGISWLGPVAEVRPGGIKIETTTAMSAGWGGAKTLWFSVRPYDRLVLKEIEFEDDGYEFTFDGDGPSDGRDTKITVIDAGSWQDVAAQVATLISSTDPCEKPDWSAEVKDAVRRRTVINGMTKRQAYLVVGEPDSATTSQDDGKKVEVWKPRQTNGIRIGFGASVESTGYPAELRFEDGKLSGLATNASGGVNLD